ncbi:MAG: sulfatase [Planctomycetota bacterium]|jgi:arylsulfatase A-like enzyme
MPGSNSLEAARLGRTAAAIASAFAAAIACSSPAREARGATRPNILFVLADDLGWRDTSLYGSRFYETPGIDALARRGMTFTDAYAANPLCSPTRASILTGQYPGRLRLTTPAGHLQQVVLDPTVPDRAASSRKRCTPGSRTRLPNEYFTIAEALKGAGYRTGFFGKWHLGRDPYIPDNQGFDVVVGGREHPGPPGGYFSPWRCATLPVVPEGEHISDVLTDEALKFLRGPRDDPFFMCLWYYDVHAPFQAKENLIAKYREKLLRPVPGPPNPQRCPTMGAMIETMDLNIGRVMRAVDELGLADDTIVIFTSDNGGNMYNEVDGTTPTSNAPLRGGKATIYEGGTREPLIVIWPGRVRAGSRSAEIVSSVDFYPTILEMAGISKREGVLLDGMSIVPALEGRALGRDTIFCHFPHDVPATGNIASTYVRRGDWKLIRFHCDGPGGADRFELYNLRDDIGEKRDMSAAMPQKVADLDRLIGRHLEDTRALVPKPNPDYAPPVGEWEAAKHCRISSREGVLVIECTGGDPHVQAAGTVKHAGPAVLRLRMRSRTRGGGQLFWGKRFHRDRSAVFHVKHDGEWHDYEARIPERGALQRLRLDPGAGAGTVEIDWMRLVSKDGRTLEAWEF